jgi:hypothetical protein
MLFVSPKLFYVNVFDLTFIKTVDIYCFLWVSTDNLQCCQKKWKDT